VAGLPSVAVKIATLWLNLDGFPPAVLSAEPVALKDPALAVPLCLVQRLLKPSSMPIQYHSRTVRREARQAVSLVQSYVAPGDTVLDVGCGEGYVGAELAEQGAKVALTDIVDVRRLRDLPFQFFDGRELPFGDRQFDVVMLNFVLHHVPNDLKTTLLGEAARVSRRHVFILEDTPRNAIDRLLSDRHGRSFREKIGSSAAYGFLTRGEWEWLFRGLGFAVREARELGRFCRAPWQPFARSVFLLEPSIQILGM